LLRPIPTERSVGQGNKSQASREFDLAIWDLRANSLGDQVSGSDLENSAPIDPPNVNQRVPLSDVKVVMQIDCRVAMGSF